MVKWLFAMIEGIVRSKLVLLHKFWQVLRAQMELSAVGPVRRPPSGSKNPAIPPMADPAARAAAAAATARRSRAEGATTTTSSTTLRTRSSCSSRSRPRPLRATRSARCSVRTAVRGIGCVSSVSRGGAARVARARSVRGRATCDMCEGSVAEGRRARGGASAVRGAAERSPTAVRRPLPLSLVSLC